MSFEEIKEVSYQLFVFPSDMLKILAKCVLKEQTSKDILNHAANSIGERDEYDPWLVLLCFPEVLFMGIIFHLIFSISRDLSFSERKQITLSLLTGLKRTLLFLTFFYFALFTLQESPFLFFHGMLYVTNYTSLVKSMLVFSGYIVMTISRPYAAAHNRHLIEYPVLFALALLFMLLLLSSCHLLTSFLAVVGFSLSLYVLILFDVDSYVAREAGIKYFYLSTFSSGFIAFAVFLFFVISKSGLYWNINLVLSTPGAIHIEFLAKIATIFLLFGIFFKLAAFPGHLWAPDVYEGSPTPILVFFMTSTKIAAFAFLHAFLSQALDALTAVWQPILALAAGGSMLWGCFAAFYEKKLRRFLAYTSINQMGFVLLGLACGTLDGYRAAMLYLFIYIGTTLGFLLVLLAWTNTDNRPMLYITDLQWLARSEKELAALLFSLATLIFSMAGIPPLAGFFGKYMLLLYSYEIGLKGLVIIGLLTSLISAYYYLGLIKFFWFTGQRSNVNLRIERTTYRKLRSYNFLWAFFLWVFMVMADIIWLNLAQPLLLFYF